MDFFVGSEEEKKLVQTYFVGPITTYKAGVYFFDSLVAGDKLGLLIEGILRLTMTNEDGKERIISFLKPYSVFGEITFFHGKDSVPQNLNISSISDAKVIFFTKEQIEDIVQKDARNAMFIFKALAHKIPSILNHLNQASFKDSYSIVCEILIALTINANKIHMTHEEIAQLANLNRVTVSRILAKLKEKGIISQGKGIITVLKRDLLKEQMEDI